MPVRDVIPVRQVRASLVLPGTMLQEGVLVFWKEVQAEEGAEAGPSVVAQRGVGAEARMAAAASAYVPVVRQVVGPVFWAAAEVMKAWRGAPVLHRAD